MAPVLEFMSQAEAEKHVQTILNREKVKKTKQHKADAPDWNAIKAKDLETPKQSFTFGEFSNGLCNVAKLIGAEAALRQLTVDDFERLNEKQRRRLCSRLGLNQDYIDVHILRVHSGDVAAQSAPPPEPAFRKYNDLVDLFRSALPETPPPPPLPPLTLEQMSLQSIRLSDVSAGASAAALSAAARPFVPGRNAHTLEHPDSQSEAGVSEASYFTSRWLPPNLV